MALINKEFTAREFADTFNGGSLTVYKVLRADMRHHGHQYKLGPNEDTVPFDPRPISGAEWRFSIRIGESGGMYFCVGGAEKVAHFLDYGTRIGTFELDPEKSRVFVEDGYTAKTNFFTLTSVCSFQDFFANRPLEIVRQNGRAIEHLTESQRTPEVCLAAVKKRGDAIRYFTESQRTPEVCLAAVQENGDAIKYLTKAQRTPDVCLAAVRWDISVIQYLTKDQRGALDFHIAEMLSR